MRTGFLSDQSVLSHCPHLQSIPLNKLQLAPRSGKKISRPQSALFMFNNLNLPQQQKDRLIENFIMRSEKSKPLTILPTRYNTLSLDHVGALVKQTQTSGDVATTMATQIIDAIINRTQVAESQSTVSPSSGLPNVNNDPSTSSYIPPTIPASPSSSMTTSSPMSPIRNPSFINQMIGGRVALRRSPPVQASEQSSTPMQLPDIYTPVPVPRAVSSLQSNLGAN